MKSLVKMNVNELRDIAVELGADRRRLYGTSKQALIVAIDDLRRKQQQAATRSLPAGDQK